MLGSSVGGQPNDLDFMLIEAMEALDARGRLWAAKAFSVGLMKMMKKNQT